MELISFFSFLVFVFGLAVGSFLNCVIYRLEKGESPLAGRSYCPHCQRELGFWDLFPVWSFLILRGRCRHCHQKISWQYPVVEISTAVIFLIIFNFQFLIFKQFLIFNFLNLFYYWLIASFLIAIFVYDLKHYIIPDKIIYSAIATAFLYQIISNFQFPISITNLRFLITNFYSPILSAIGAAIFFLLIVLVSRGKWMGIGDIKLAFFMGLFLGFPDILVALFLAFFFGAIMGIGLIISGKRTLKSEVPFGPFLVTGTFIALFWGQEIIDWYLSLFYL